MADAAADESILADQNGRHIRRCILSNREDLLTVDDVMVHDCVAPNDVQQCASETTRASHQHPLRAALVEGVIPEVRVARTLRECNKRAGSFVPPPRLTLER